MIVRLHLPFTCTHKAIERGELSTVKQWLFKEDTRVNESKGGRAFPGHNTVANGNALHWAVHYEKLEIAQLLLDNGAGISLLW